MSPKVATSPLTLELHSISGKLQLLRTLKRVSFSGKLIWKSRSGLAWVIFFNSGEIVYATGGYQSIRRWYRYLYQQCPPLAANFRALQQQLIAIEEPLLPKCPDYSLLHNWLTQGKLSPNQFRQIVEAIASEILFDISQQPETTHELRQTKPVPVDIALQASSEAVAANVAQLWQRWQMSELPNYPLSYIPTVLQPEQLKAATSPKVYQMLTTVIDGKRTLWDIIIKTRKDAIQIVKALHPYLKVGWIELMERQHNTGKPAHAPPSRRSTAPAVACVDDSPMVCQSLEQIVRSSGYEFVGILDASRAIAALLNRKPQVIFLDLIMPETNGYEICSQLRKTSQFKETPIIILTGNDGVVDQVRARLMGATDFISKPVEATIISNIIRKYLPVSEAEA
ncbi:MAG: response regulator [Elainellaceae cyanobacterium]